MGVLIGGGPESIWATRGLGGSLLGIKGIMF